MDIFENRTAYLGNIYGIYENFNYNSNFDLKSGIVFTKEDMNSKNKVAVIGENIEKQTYKENNKQYIISGQDKFEVIGVLKDSKVFNSSDFILYNLNSILDQPNKLIPSCWIVESNRLSTSELNKILSDLNEKYNNEIEISMNDGYRFDNDTFLFIKQNMIIAFTLTMLTIIIALIRSIILWLSSLNVELGVRMCSGCNNLELIKLISIRYLKSVIFSILISILLIYIFTAINVNIIYFDFNLKLILNLILINLILFALISIILIYKFKKITIGNLLKGKG